MKRSGEAAQDLSHLIRELQACVDSAATRLASGKEKVIRSEATRLRRMLAAWEDLRVANELDVRMQFTESVDFFARVTSASDRAGRPTPASRHRALEYRAAMIKQKVHDLNPALAANLDVAAVAHAIDRRSQGGRWDWLAVIRAWGRPNMSEETWRAEWKKWCVKRRA